MKWLLKPSLWLLALWLLPLPARAQQLPSSWVIGASGEPWSEPALRWIALDDSTRPGALMLREISPDQNVLRERVRLSGVIPRNIFKYKWSFNRGRYAMEVDTLLVGWHPRLWQGGAANAVGTRSLVDGDELVVSFTLAPPAVDRPSPDTWITLDLGVPLAIDSLAFFPPQNGLNSSNQRLRDLYPEAYEVSRTAQVLDWLVFEDETASTGSSRYHPLEEILASTFSNNQSIVGLQFPLRFTRFLRLKMGGVRTTGILAEIKAFGRGFPAEGRYLSQPRSFGQPVSFGKITWKFTKYRKTAAGAVLEDPAAPVQLVLRTRSGTTPDPQAYFIFDELGRQVQVDRESYFDVQAPTGSFEDGLPNFRAAVTDDIGNWNAWSIGYQQSGEELRSSDGREFLQFRFEIATADPLAFGVLDSLAFEISPLLADSVLAEVSLADQPVPPGGTIEVPLGVDTVFVYDLRAVIRDARQPGFDGFDLDAPRGARFLDLEIDGTPATEGRDFSLSQAEDGRLGFAFPRRFTADVSFRVRFRAAIFQPSVFLGGNLLDRDPAAATLPQSIEEGDARSEVKSDKIQVVASQAALKVLGELRLDPPVFTPNGDGRNDETEVDFALFGVQAARVEVGLYDLSGRRIALLSSGAAAAGRYRPAWNGRDSGGALVPPGLYLLKIEVEVDEGRFSRVKPVAVVY